MKVEKLFDGDKLLLNQNITIENGVIRSIETCSSDEVELKGMLIPGYIDIQVNGGGGVLFNQTPSYQAIEKIGQTHLKYGTTGWLPTLVTDSLEKMVCAADAVAEAIEKGVPGVLGIHFEGPFLSKAKKGVHSESLIRNISTKELEQITRKDLGKVVLTVAPESVSCDQIKQLVSNGVIVSLGHSNASFEQTMLALDAGATGFTHLFNAMSAFTSREPGMVGAAILDRNSFSGIVLDGIHVHPESARLAYLANKNLVLVTDAMPPVGTSEKSFEFFGNQIKREGLKLTDENGRLAGSALDMNTAVQNAEEMLNIEQQEAIRLGTLNPAKFLGIESAYGTIKVETRASMLLLNDERQILSRWIDGVEML